jgi:hypothetical protein
MSDFKIKRGNTRPFIRSVLSDQFGPYDLTGYDVVFKFQNTQGGPVYGGDATVRDASGGSVLYEWTDGDTDAVGIYECEWVATATGGGTMSFPNSRKDYFEILDGVG